jgi:hypothetical protein
MTDNNEVIKRIDEAEPHCDQYMRELITNCRAALLQQQAEIVELNRLLDTQGAILDECKAVAKAKQDDETPYAYHRKYHGTDAGLWLNTEGLRLEMSTEPFASEYEYVPLYIHSQDDREYGDAVQEGELQDEPKVYVPMTDDDFDKVLQNIPHYSDATIKWDYERNLEAAVVKRAGLILTPTGISD